MIGLGLLGSALARAYADAGDELTVWNRSTERADPFRESAGIASSAAATCAASEVVVCLISPAACRSVLRNPAVEAALEDTTLVQPTTGTPADAVEEAAWAAERGAGSLGGAILAHPAMVGTDRATAFYLGPRGCFERVVPWLRTLTSNSVHLGDEIGRAATMDHALPELAYGCQAVLIDAMALCEAGSVPVGDFLDQVTLVSDGFSSSASVRSDRAPTPPGPPPCTPSSRGPSSW